MYKIYLKAKEEFIDFVIDYELHISDYTSKQKKIVDFK